MPDILQFIQIHFLLASALLAVLLVLIMLEFIKQKQSANKATPLQVTQLINRANAAVVDIRPGEAFNNGHIIGSLSIPSAELAAKTKKLEKFKSSPLIMVSATGVEATESANLLMKHGFNVQILAGGIRAWREAEMPLVKE